MKKRKFLLVTLLLCLLCSLPVSAAVKTDGWHKAANGKSYYYIKGKIAKGFVKIKNKTCYFNKNGKLVKNSWFFYKRKKYRADKYGTIKKNCSIKVDGKLYSLRADGSVRKGWQKLSKGTYYFGSDGAMRKGVQTIGKKTYVFSSRGILLKGIQKRGNTTYYLTERGSVDMKKVSSGRKTTYYDAAGKRLNSTRIREFETLLKAKEIVGKITNNGMSQEQKLKACFDWVIAKPYVTRRKFSNVDGWPAMYANDHFVLGGGNCEADASAFAYLAKVLGYTNVYVCTDSAGQGLPHAWTEINGLVYDPLFAEAKNYHKYYGATYKTYELHPILHIKI